MTLVPQNLADDPSGNDFTICKHCGAGLERLVLGGVGDWANTVQCSDCFRWRDVSFRSVIAPILARRLGISVERVLLLHDEAQQEYERVASDLLDR